MCKIFRLFNLAPDDYIVVVIEDDLSYRFWLDFLEDSFTSRFLKKMFKQYSKELIPQVGPGMYRFTTTGRRGWLGCDMALMPHINV